MNRFHDLTNVIQGYLYLIFMVSYVLPVYLFCSSSSLIGKNRVQNLV